jgi:hypothetical protein
MKQITGKHCKKERKKVQTEAIEVGKNAVNKKLGTRLRN